MERGTHEEVKTGLPVSSGILFIVTMLVAFLTATCKVAGEGGGIFDDDTPVKRPELDQDSLDVERMVKEYREIVEKLIATAAADEGKPLEPDDPRLLAIALLGEYRADTENALSFLIRHVTMAPPGIENPKPAQYPCVAALIQIGKPASQLAVIRLGQTRGEQEYQLRRDLLTYAILEIEGEEIGWAILEKQLPDIGDRESVASILEQARQRRLDQWKSGKGESVSLTGTLGARAGVALAEALGTEYVRARAVVRVDYAPASSDAAAVGAFLATRGAGEAARPQRELLLLAGRPDEAAMRAHGARWAELGAAEHVIAGRGAAVIVNPANQLSSLTQEQIRGIFSGEMADWATIGGTGLAAGGAAAVEIRAYGLAASDPVAGLFQRECLGASGRLGRVTVKADSSEVIRAVATDPAGIGVVDLASVGPVGAMGTAAGDRSVKVLALGSGAQVSWPSADNLKNAMYPLSERFYLYVHPQASEAAKDFATFVATCGASAATPYADTVGSTMAAYRGSGLIPLGEAAMDRAAQEALKATTAPAPAATP